MEFESNPDIDEKPPIPLRDALEKMKPFLMAYEGIQSHEEWEVHFCFCFCFLFIYLFLMFLIICLMQLCLFVAKVFLSF